MQSKFSKNVWKKIAVKSSHCFKKKTVFVMKKIDSVRFTITSKALLKKAIEEGSTVVTESWAGVSLMTEPMFGIVILKLPQLVRSKYCQ